MEFYCAISENVYGREKSSKLSPQIAVPMCVVICFWTWRFQGCIGMRSSHFGSNHVCWLLHCSCCSHRFRASIPEPVPASKPRGGVVEQPTTEQTARFQALHQLVVRARRSCNRSDSWFMGMVSSVRLVALHFQCL